MSINNQLKKIEDLYTDNLKKLGSDDSRSVGWNTPGCQKLRFAKLMQVVDNDDHFSLNDLGCGYASLVDFITEDLGLNLHKYIGFDISSDMLEAARNKIINDGHDINKYEFIKSNIIKAKADYSIASGIFNVRFDAHNDEWIEHIKSTLANMNKYSEKGFAFNLLTSYVDWKENHLFYAEPSYWFDYCKNNFSKHVSLLHDYPLYEWTIVVKK